MQKNDRIVQARCSSITLAIITKALQADGILVTNTSQLVRSALDWLADIIKENTENVGVSGLAEAIQILDNLGLNKKPGKYKYMRLTTINDPKDVDSDWNEDPKDLAKKYGHLTKNNSETS